MAGSREVVAKAAALECMRSAHRHGRKCYLYAFSGPSQVCTECVHEHNFPRDHRQAHPHGSQVALASGAGVSAVPGCHSAMAVCNCSSSRQSAEGCIWPTSIGQLQAQ